MNTLHTQLLIIGGGPGGYVAAIRAGQAGLKTVLVEAKTLGGTCLNVGCIPSKALLHAAEQFEAATHAAADGGNALGIRVQSPVLDLAKTMAWKDGIVAKLTGGVAHLVKKQKVEVLTATARIVDGKTVIATAADGSETKISCDNLLLATGSTPVQIPGLPFGGDILSSTEALALTAVPAHLAVVGGGYIGLELGTAYAKLGAKVTVVEAQDRVLPAYDAELVKPVVKALAKLGITVLTGAKAQGFANGQLTVQMADGTTQAVKADKVLVAVGRKTMTEGLNLEALQLTMGPGHSVAVDAQCKTSMTGVYAIGDLTGEPMLAHRAMAQGEVAVDAIAGKKAAFQPQVIPAVCFTDPEVVVVGLSPEQAKAQGIAVKTASFPFAGNGRAMTLEAGLDGFIRVVAREDNHRILGWQAVGTGVSELCSTFAHSIEMNERLEDVAHIIHAHPTLGEVVQEAAHKGLGRALHG